MSQSFSEKSYKFSEKSKKFSEMSKKFSEISNKFSETSQKILNPSFWEKSNRIDIIYNQTLCLCISLIFRIASFTLMLWCFDSSTTLTDRFAQQPRGLGFVKMRTSTVLKSPSGDALSLSKWDLGVNQPHPNPSPKERGCLRRTFCRQVPLSCGEGLGWGLKSVRSNV